MKILFSLFIGFILVSPSTYAQGINKTEPQQFWETNIQAILESNVEEVVNQSHFPLNTFEGEWSENDFVDAFEILFSEVELSELRSQSYRDIQMFEDEDGATIYMVVILTETEIEGEYYESATILSFKKFDGQWKLYDIDMAG